MRQLALVYHRGRGFDLFDVDPDRAPLERERRIAEGLSVPTLTRFFVEGARQVGEWAGKNAGPLAVVGRALLAQLGSH